MKRFPFLLLALLILVAALAAPAHAAWPGYAYGSVNLRMIRYDTSYNSKSGRLSITYGASTDSVYAVGFAGENISVQAVTADVWCQPLGDPDCIIADSRTFGASKVIANPLAGRPCVDWGLVTITTLGYDFGNGGIIFLRVKGKGVAGSLDIIKVSRGSR